MTDYEMSSSVIISTYEEEYYTFLVAQDPEGEFITMTVIHHE